MHRRKQPKTVLSVQHGGGSAERDRNLTSDTLWLFGLVATCYSAIALLTFTMRAPLGRAACRIWAW